MTQIRQSGTGAMAAIIGGDQRGRPFPSLPQPWHLAFVRVHFARLAGSGTDVANLVLSVLGARGAVYDTVLHTRQSVGVAADVNLRIAPEERDCWIFDDEDLLLLSWGNPDVGELTWGITVGVD